MIRHAGLLLAASPPVLPLVVVMIEPTLRALLVPFIGLPPLLTPGPITAFCAAITMSPITARADEKHGMTLRAGTNPMKENRFAVNRRHA